MTKELLAEKLNGMQYREKISEELIQLAKEHGLLIVTGASDDLIEFEGAFEDEGSCYGGDTFYINSLGILIKPDEDSYEDEDEYFKLFKNYMQNKKRSRVIVSEWCKVDGYCWTYLTSIPHACFDVLEDDDKYCRGIVIDIKYIS